MANFGHVELIVVSDFKEIFNWQHFIKSLEDDIQVVEALPPHLADVKPLVKTPVSWSKASSHITQICLLQHKASFTVSNTLAKQFFFLS